jgi:hypothetical protein
MTNTTAPATDPYIALRPGSHVQTADGAIHHVQEVKIRRTPKRQLLREAKIRSDITRGWIDLMDAEWRVVHPAAQVTPGAQNCVDGLDHSLTCHCAMTHRWKTSDGWIVSCRRCGFAVRGYDTPEAATAAYVADQTGIFRTEAKPSR